MFVLRRSMLRAPSPRAAVAGEAGMLLLAVAAVCRAEAALARRWGGSEPSGSSRSPGDLHRIVAGSAVVRVGEGDVQRVDRSRAVDVRRTPVEGDGEVRPAAGDV